MFENSLLLDIGRKYYSSDFIKALIDKMSQYKLNTLLLHFSEDMGLGLECPAYPFLSGRDGALCTQEDLSQSKLDLRYLSVTDLKDIINYARVNSVSVIPSFDSPGHLNFHVKKLHEYVKKNGEISFAFNDNNYKITYENGFEFFKNGNKAGNISPLSKIYGIGNYYLYKGKHAIVQGSRNTEHSRGIDISNEVACAFIFSVIKSFSDLFLECGCTEFDIGADELLGFGNSPNNSVPKWMQLEHWSECAKRKYFLPCAVPYDLFVGYINELSQMLKGFGWKSIRIWNDEFMREADTDWAFDRHEHLQFDKNLIIQYWTCRDTAPYPQILNSRGYDIVGAESKYSYYVLIRGARNDIPTNYVKVNPVDIYNEWEKDVICSQKITNHLKGTMFCVWSDLPILKGEDEILHDLDKLLEARYKKGF